LAAETKIPYASNLWKLRRLLEEVDASGDLAAAGSRVALSRRFVDYYGAAAEVLGLAKRAKGTLVLSAMGRALLATKSGTPFEAAIFRKAIEECAVVMRVAPTLLADRGPTEAELELQLRQAGLAASTAEQRAKALMRWRKYILQHERQLPISSPVNGPRVPRYNGRPMLRKLKILNFKAFGEGNGGVEASAPQLSLQPLTILAGPNGAGKSTILQALDVLGFLVRGSIAEMLEAHGWDYGDLPHLRSARQTVSLEVELDVGGSILVWNLTLGTRKHPGIAAETIKARGRDDAAWRVLLQRSGRNVEVLDESRGVSEPMPPVTHPQSWLSTLDPREDAARVPGLLKVKAWAEGIHAFWSLDPSALRAPSRSASDRIGSRGGDLASFLFRLQRSQRTRFMRFVQRVRRYYPRLVKLEARSGKYGWKRLEITERWNRETATFNARQVSDGLLRMMVVASLPEWRMPPSLVLLDEVENGLHPRLVGGICGLLSELSSEIQVVATTHSPITLNYVPAEATLLVTRSRSGTATVTPLKETKSYARLREQFEPGELWYNVGEERLLDTKGAR
jgi:predicted ATPase